MKLSMLIAECQKVLVEHGDMDVTHESVYPDNPYPLQHIEAVRVRKNGLQAWSLVMEFWHERLDIRRACEIKTNRVDVTPPPVSVGKPYSTLNERLGD